MLAHNGLYTNLGMSYSLNIELNTILLILSKLHMFCIQKLQRRIKTLSTLNMEENEVKKWSKVLKMEYISSEESDGEDSIDSGIVIKPLSWRSKRLNSMFDHLDQQVSSTRSSQALRQTKKRVISDVPSTRMVPRNIPKWAIANTP